MKAHRIVPFVACAVYETCRRAFGFQAVLLLACRSVWECKDHFGSGMTTETVLVFSGRVYKLSGAASMISTRKHSIVQKHFNVRVSRRYLYRRP